MGHTFVPRAGLRRLLAVAGIAAGVSGAAACRRPADTAPPVAAITVSVNRAVVESGAPLDLEYRFTRTAGAPAIGADHWVFVHMLDETGGLLWTDDHQPPVAASAWGAAPVVYRRTMFVPRIPYTGRVQVEAGLYAPNGGARLPLSGTPRGNRAYAVATFEVRPLANGVFLVFGDGFYGAEQAGNDAAQTWRWSKGDARLSFRNPGRDAVLSLEIDQPVAQVGPQTAELRVGSDLIETIAVTPGARRILRVPLPARRLGTSETVDLDLHVRPTFVPAAVPGFASQDARELGVRVFNAYVGVE